LIVVETGGTGPGYGIWDGQLTKAAELVLQLDMTELVNGPRLAEHPPLVGIG
jgi:hypothetical protein